MNPKAYPWFGVDLAENAKAIVANQAENEGLWFVAKTAPEALLQQELRRLHEAVERDLGGEQQAYEQGYRCGFREAILKDATSVAHVQILAERAAKRRK